MGEPERALSDSIAGSSSDACLFRGLALTVASRSCVMGALSNKVFLIGDILLTGLLTTTVPSSTPASSEIVSAFSKRVVPLTGEGLFAGLFTTTVPSCALKGDWGVSGAMEKESWNSSSVGVITSGKMVSAVKSAAMLLSSV